MIDILLEFAMVITFVFSIILCPFKAADFLLNLSEDSQYGTLEAYCYQRIEIKGSDWLFNKEELSSCKFAWKEKRVKLPRS